MSTLKLLETKKQCVGISSVFAVNGFLAVHAVRICLCLTEYSTESRADGEVDHRLGDT